MTTTLCILPSKFGLGGPGSFHARLTAVLAKRGMRITHDPLDPANAAILVIGGTRQINNLKLAKKNGVRIVQRLNGMNWVHRKTFTGIRHFIRAEINNMILASIREFADAIIYQSRFSRDWWVRERGATTCPHEIIYNGVDLHQFTPEGVKDLPAGRMRILLVEGNLGNGYEGGLTSAVGLIKLLNVRQSLPAEIMVVGNASQQLRQKFEGLSPAIFWRGVVKREEIPMIDRSAHLLFSADINAACPNSVIEALACGLPVIGYDTGALPELLEGGGLIARHGSDPWKLQKPDLYPLADAAARVISNREDFSKAARKHAEKTFDIQEIADRYLEVLVN